MEIDYRSCYAIIVSNNNVLCTTCGVEEFVLQIVFTVDL